MLLQIHQLPIQALRAELVFLSRCRSGRGRRSRRTERRRGTKDGAGFGRGRGRRGRAHGARTCARVRARARARGTRRRGALGRREGAQQGLVVPAVHDLRGWVGRLPGVGGGSEGRKQGGPAEAVRDDARLERVVEEDCGV